MPKMTLATKLVLRALLEDSFTNNGGMYGREINDRTGLPSGTVQPILIRLEGAGWAKGIWEEGWEPDWGRPRRRYWHLTMDGQEAARHAKEASK